MILQVMPKSPPALIMSKFTADISTAKGRLAAPEKRPKDAMHLAAELEACKGRMVYSDYS
jgi:hypothetical protein